MPNLAANKAIAITDKLHSQLLAATPPGTALEGLANVLLYLALTDGHTLAQAADLMKRLGLGGATDLQNRGW